MNYNDGTSQNYSRGDELVRIHTNSIITREDKFRVSHLGNYHGNEAVFAFKWMKKRNDWSKGAVFMEYFHSDKDTFS